MTKQDSQQVTASTRQIKPINHHSASDALWWFDLCTTAGRKADNQDSVLITTCLPELLDGTPVSYQYQQAKTSSTGTPSAKQRPLLVLLADGVSACQFPKQASYLAIETVAEKLTLALVDYAKSLTDPSLTDPPLNEPQANSDLTSDEAAMASSTALAESDEMDDEVVASLIKHVVTKANDTLYFSQAYDRVPPLLTTLSGVLCLGNRIHLFHTGDSRIYRVGVDQVTVLSEDHRIHHGQDKGALSAALGADTKVDLQQSVFTLHQNECLALMTDGVYEPIEATELQYELCQAVQQRIRDTENSDNEGFEDHGGEEKLQGHSEESISQQICEHAYLNGSYDNLSMVMIGINEPVAGIGEGRGIGDQGHRQDSTLNSTLPSKEVTRYRLPTGLEIGDSIDGFCVVQIIARTARSEVYLVEDAQHNQFVLKSPSMNTVDDGNYLREFLKERKIGLSLSKHRQIGEAAHNQANPNLVQSQPLETIGSPRNSPKNSRSGMSDSGLLRYFPVPAGSPYLYHLTEYIEGESLRDFIERHAPCDVWQTYDLLTKIGMAVRVMHRNYLLHQDIKPENILLSKSGTIKLIDFGSASSSILKDSTRPPNGDLHYAAPEYYSDAPKGVHSEIFSMAVIGYELLTGQRPFSPQALMTPSHALVMPVAPLRKQNVADTSQQALLRALHPNPEARYQAIGEFLQDFNPDNSAIDHTTEPLIKRNPLLVWHSICFIEAIIIVMLLIKLSKLS